jgi:hypothetical protein
MQRDIETLNQIHLHRTVGSNQLARLCFSDVSFETARKRLRRLHQAGFIGSASSERMEGRGRPGLVYFLTLLGAKSLADHWGVARETIPTGPPHAYHKEHFLKVVDLHLILLHAQQNKMIQDLQFSTGRELGSELSPEYKEVQKHADAIISFRYIGKEKIKVLLVMDSGNFRQGKHWEPKINIFLLTGYPIWVVSASVPRIATLGEWTKPLLEKAKVGPGKCVFAMYEDILAHGIFGALWQRTDGTITDLKIK